MTQNRQSQNNGRNQETNWNNEGLSHNNDRGYRSQDGSNEDDTQRNAQGSSPRWNQSRGYRDENSRYSDDASDRGNYAGRGYGSGNQRREWEEPWAVNDYSSQQPYRQDRSQNRGYDEDTRYGNRGNDNRSHGMYGNDYAQGQYGAQMGRNPRGYNETDNYRQGGNSGQNTGWGSWNSNFGSASGNQDTNNYRPGNEGFGNLGRGNSGTSNRGSNNNSDAMGGNRQDDLSGEHRGKGPKGYHRSDDRIKEDISDRLSDDGQIDASDIELQVDNGVVSLSGSVESREVKRRAEDLAESISGVTNVENRLRVNKENSADKEGTGEENTPDRKNSGLDHKKKHSLAGAHN